MSAALAFSAAAIAAEPKDSKQRELEELRALIRQQAEEFQTQARRIEALGEVVEKAVTSSGVRSASEENGAIVRAAAVSGPPPASNGHRPSNGHRVAQAEKAPPATSKPATASKPKRPGPPGTEFAGIYQARGVLTRAHSFVIEPSLEYTNSTINRFFFSGAEVADTVLVGQIEASDADRDTLVAAVALRYGVDNRLEYEVKVPYVYRDDRVTPLINNTERDRTSVTSHSLGDVEVSARYQFNQGAAGWPVFVGGLRIKTDTGEGPFDVDRDADGIETELATGSGFWGLDGSVSVILPSDPAVFFASFSYLWHIARDIDKKIGGVEIGRVDPGDVFNMGFGMGLSINDQASFSLGYKHAFILESETEAGGVIAKSEGLDVGKLTLGFAYILSESVAVNLSFEAGVTDDAPDVTMRLRLPIKFSL